MSRSVSPSRRSLSAKVSPNRRLLASPAIDVCRPLEVLLFSVAQASGSIRVGGAGWIIDVPATPASAREVQKRVFDRQFADALCVLQVFAVEGLATGFLRRGDDQAVVEPESVARLDFKRALVEWNARVDPQ